MPSHSQIKTPRFYLLNPTSLAKSHAIALLGTDLRVNNIDVCHNSGELVYQEAH